MSIEDNTTATNTNASNKLGVLSLAIKEKMALYSAYMPFVAGGGLFIPTMKPYKMGDEIFMMLNLPDETEKINVAGKVVWVNPIAQNGKPQGIGVQFNQDNGGRQSKEKIEASIGSLINSNRPTNTI